jgi:hypothetical protein
MFNISSLDVSNNVLTLVITESYMTLELYTVNVTCLEFRRWPDVNITPDLALRLEGLTLNIPYTTEGNVDRS